VDVARIAVEPFNLLIFNLRDPAFLIQLKLLRKKSRFLALAITMGVARVQDAERLFKEGVDEILGSPFQMPLLLKKVEEMLAPRVAPAPAEAEVKLAGGVKVPKALDARVTALRENGRLLGDVAEITPGVIAHERARRYARPAPEWQTVLTESSIQTFFVNDEREYYLIRRDTVNRVPAPDEYDVPEKVVMRRSRSPLVVALDASALPYSGELFGIVPVTGLQAGYLACVLNSRYTRFFLNVYRGAAAITAMAGSRHAGAARGAYLTRFDLEALPLVIAKPREQDGLSELARQVSAVAPNDRDDRRREERARMLIEIDRQVMKIFQFSPADIKELTAAGF
jgi:hypothetical protein